MKNLLEDLLQGKDLSEEQAHGLMRELAGGQMEPAQAFQSDDLSCGQIVLGRSHDLITGVGRCDI